MPPAISGAGGHLATFAVARALIGFDLSVPEALELLRRWNESHCQPPWSEGELLHKLKTVNPQWRGHLLGDGNRPGRPMMTYKPKPKPPTIDPTTATENFLDGYRATEAEVLEASPIRPSEDWRQDTSLLFEALYRAGENIAVITDFTQDGDKAKPRGYGTTLPCEEWLSLIRESGPPEDEAGAWFKMNPTDGKGIADVNITACRYALIECDKIPVELQLSLIVKLPLPVAGIVTSGGRSVHALIRVDAVDAHEYRATVSKILVLLSRFGVDSQNKNPSRGARLPGAQRIIGAMGDGRQQLLYLNDSPNQKPIL